MSSLGEFLGSSASLHLLCMGVSVMIGLLHVWMARRPWDLGWWTAVWAGLACVFLGARGVHLTTSEPQAALLAGKVAFATAPFLVWALLGLGRSLAGKDLDGRGNLGFGAISLAWAIAIIGTPWFVEPEVTTRTDLFGETHFAVHARWPVAVLALYIAGAGAWGIRRLRTQSRLEPGERHVLMAGFGLYAALGVAAVLTSVEVLTVPALAEYGPFVVAVCLCYMGVRRRRRVESRLEEVLEEQRSQLAASEARYGELVEHAPLGVLVCDADGAIDTMNPCMQRMLAGADPFDDPVLRGILARVRDTRDIVRARHAFTMGSNGRDVVWQLTASPLEGAAVLLLADDVTERSRLEQQLQQAQKMDSIGQLAAGLAHEINNPMAYVRANLRAMHGTWDRLRKEPSDAEAGTELETLIDESMEGVERTIAIVADMREFAHAGDENLVATDLSEVLDACVRVASVYERRDVTVTSRVPTLEVAGAAGPLRQVFLKLLINGIQAVGRDGNVWIDARETDGHVVVAVHDDGPGVPQPARARLFDPFFTTKPTGEGTGLGLYISYQIVRGYGGDITVGTGPHGGASFEVSLPVAASASARAS